MYDVNNKNSESIALQMRDLEYQYALGIVTTKQYEFIAKAIRTDGIYVRHKRLDHRKGIDFTWAIEVKSTIYHEITNQDVL